MPYLHGAGNIIPGLEEQMAGKQAGDKFTAVILPADGYGEFNPEAFIQVPRAQLPEGIEFQKGVATFSPRRKWWCHANLHGRI